MKKIIFLDIDGVLTVPSSKYCLDRERMKLLVHEDGLTPEVVEKSVEILNNFNIS